MSLNTVFQHHSDPAQAAMLPACGAQMVSAYFYGYWFSHGLA